MKPNPTNDPIQVRFERFHQENPVVLELFVRFARELRATGQPTGGAKAIFERIRWELAIATTAHDFKLNNNYSSRYARLAMETHADLAGFFRVRSLSSLSGDRPQARPAVHGGAARPQSRPRRARRAGAPMQLVLGI